MQNKHLKKYSTLIHDKNFQQTRNRGGFSWPDKGQLRKPWMWQTQEDYLDSRQIAQLLSSSLAWSRIEIPDNTISQVVLISPDNPDTSSWWEHTCRKKWAPLLVLCGTGIRTGCFTMTTSCRNRRVKRTLDCWRSSLLNRIEALRTRLCGKKLAVQPSLGISWEPELAISLMQQHSRDLEMRFLEVRK